MNSFATRLLATLAIAIMANSISGCSTPNRLTSSPPGTEVWSGAKRLGATPLGLAEANLDKPVAGGHLLRLERPGYHRIWVWLPESASGVDISVTMEAFRFEDSSKKTTERNLSRPELYRMSARTLAMQTALLVSKEINLVEFEDMVKNFPNLASAHQLHAMALLRSDRRDDARAALRRALSLSQNDPDALALFYQLGGKPVDLSSDTQVPAGSTSGATPATPAQPTAGGG